MVVESPFVSALSGITDTNEEVITIRLMVGVRRAELRILVVPSIAGMITSRSESEYSYGRQPDRAQVHWSVEASILVSEEDLLHVECSQHLSVRCRMLL
jgi:phage gpG-like protein